MNISLELTEWQEIAKVLSKILINTLIESNSKNLKMVPGAHKDCKNTLVSLTSLLEELWPTWDHVPYLVAMPQSTQILVQNF